MKEMISLFVKTLMKREEKGVIKVERDTFPRNIGRSTSVDSVLYDNLDGYIITEDKRNIRFEIVELDSQYIKLAAIDNDVVIAFDCSKKNEADEWDIINYQSKYVITKTLGSFLNNKIWAWLDRKRKIWDKELYEK
jgi:hypothetical protein